VTGVQTCALPIFLERVGGNLAELTKNLGGELTDLCISGNVETLLDYVSPCTHVPADHDLCFRGVRHYGSCSLTGLLPVESLFNKKVNSPSVCLFHVVMSVRPIRSDYSIRSVIIPCQSRRCDHRSVFNIHVPLRQLRERQVAMPDQLVSQRAGNAFDKERHGSVLKHGLMALLQDVGKVALVRLRLRVFTLPCLVAVPTGELSESVRIASVELIDVRRPKVYGSAPHNRASNQKNLHISSWGQREPRSSLS